VTGAAGLNRSPSTAWLAVVATLSSRLQEIVDNLPLRHVLAVDRSAKAIAAVRRSAAALIAANRLTARELAAEELELGPGEARYDIAFAVRVGAFDGRQPHAGAVALERLGHALLPGGRLFIDGGDPLRELVVATR
jgi:hypothetical protein